MKKSFAILIICFIIFLLHFLFIVIAGHLDSIQKADVIVVFGNKVENDGTPSGRLKARLDEAFRLYNEGFAPIIFVSGGFGKEGYEEAEVMAQYLIEKGIPAENIYKDFNGYDTEQTSKNLKVYMDKNSYKSVIAVSSYYHIPRIKMYFKKIGIPTVYNSRAQYYELRDFYSIFREIIAYYSYALKVPGLSPNPPTMKIVG